MQETSQIHWYILRYRTLSKRLREDIQSCPACLYLPMQTIKNKNPRAAKVNYIQTPVLNGYLFVHGTYRQAREVSSSLGLPMWKKQVSKLELQESHETLITEESLFYYIHDEEMRTFQRAVDLQEFDITMLDASNIDLEKDDKVMLTEGLMKGTKGYLKTDQGRDGGLVIVPLMSNSEEDITPIGICYTIKAKPNQIGVLEFAKGNLHFHDKMRSARKTIDEALRLHLDGKEITVQQRERLIAYTQRYTHLKISSNIQMANHLINLYQIYAILQMRTQMSEVKAKISSIVLPAIKSRVEEAKKRGKESDQEIKYRAMMTEAEKAIEINNINKNIL